MYRSKAMMVFVARTDENANGLVYWRVMSRVQSIRSNLEKIDSNLDRDLMSSVVDRPTISVLP